MTLYHRLSIVKIKELWFREFGYRDMEMFIEIVQ